MTMKIQYHGMIRRISRSDGIMGKVLKGVLAVVFVISALIGLGMIANSYTKVKQASGDVDVACATLKGSVMGLQTALQGVEDAGGASVSQRNSVSNSVQNYNVQCSERTGTL